MQKRSGWLEKGGYRVKVIRWILVVPVSVSGFVLSFYAAIVVTTVLDYYCFGYRTALPICPPQQVAARVMYGLLILFPALAAVLVVWFAYLVAPGHKRTTAVVAYIAGAVCACFMGLAMKTHAALLAALLSGAVVLLIIFIRGGRSRIAEQGRG